MMKNWLRSARNVVTDNFFTSIRSHYICRHYSQEQTRHTTAVGNETEQRGKSSIFAFSGNLTLVFYAPKKDKIVTLLSLMQHDTQVEGEERKPHIILFIACNFPCFY